MKTLVLIIVWLCSCCITFAQRKENFKKLIEQTNAYFSVYEHLSPFGEEYYTLKELGITKEDIQQLNNEGDSDGYTFNTDVDSVETSAVILMVQGKIRSNIYKITAHPDFKKYDIRNLLTSGELRIIKSEDNKLYNFSFDAKNGGTYQMQISIMHYTGYDLKQTNAVNTSDNESNDVDFVFSEDGYNGINTIYTAEGTKYLLTGYVRGCSSCYGLYVALITFHNNKFIQEFYYSIDSNDYESNLTYTPETKTILATYKIFEPTSYCNCDNENKEEEESHTVTEGDEPGGTYIEGTVNEEKQEVLAKEFDDAIVADDESATEGDESGEDYTKGTVEEVTLETEQEVEDEGNPIVRQCSCTFVFDGKTFQLKKKSSEIVETEDE